MEYGVSIAVLFIIAVGVYAGKKKKENKSEKEK